MIGSRGVTAVLLAAGALALVSASAPAKPAAGECWAVSKLTMDEKGCGPTVAGSLSGYWVGGTGRAETWAGLYHESDQRYTALVIGHLDKHTAAPFAIAADKDGNVFFQIPTGKGEARRVPVEKLLKLVE